MTTYEVGTTPYAGVVDSCFFLLLNKRIEGRKNNACFVQDKYDISLRFRGSSNQRIIDMNRTRAAGHVVLWQDDPIFADHKM